MIIPKKKPQVVKQIHLEFNKLFAPVFTTKARYIDIWGGRARGGSHFGTDYFLFLITRPEYFRGSFLRAVFGDIRGSLWQDFKDRVDRAEKKGDVRAEDFNFNESQMSVTYLPTGNSIISKGFKKSSGSSSAKLKSLAGLTHVLIEECEEVGEDDFNKLDDSLRTDQVENIQVIRLFNPPHKNHWLIKRFYNLVPCGLTDEKGKLIPWYKAIPKNIIGFLSIHSTYKDNLKNLNDTTIRKYESYGSRNSPNYNPDFYYRDVLGLVSEGKKGRILTNVYPMSYEFFMELPFDNFYGLDFGYSEDPVALMELKHHNKSGYMHQVIYETHLTDDDLANLMSIRGVNKKRPIYADNAEPKSIETLRQKGFSVLPSRKGADSIKNGIKYLQSLDLFLTENSKETWLETEEYSWALDTNKEPTDLPIDDHNHAIDATRYGFTGHTQKGLGKLTVSRGIGREED